MKDQDHAGQFRAGEARSKGHDTRSEKRQGHSSLLDRMRSLFGMGPASIRDDIEDALDETDTAEVFSPQERAMLRNVLGLHEVSVEDIMVPRADIVAVSTSMSLEAVLGVFRSVGHSRLPVHGDTLDDPRGMIHIRDFVNVLTDSLSDPAARPLDLSIPVSEANLLRPVLFAPPSMQAIDLLKKMQASRTHMALVIDEYGGTDGLVSIEDIVEVIVGDIEDEHDEDERPLVDRLPDGTFVADGRASLEDVSAALGLDLAGGAEAEEIDTIGGLVTSIVGRVPNRGELVTELDQFDLEVLEADPRRVKKVRIRRRASAAAGAPVLSRTGSEGVALASGQDKGLPTA